MMNLNRSWRRRRRSTPRPTLRFSPYAWAKLIYLRDRGETEIGGFGLSDAVDPLLIVDVLTIKQRCTPVTVAFDDAAVADLFDELVDQGVHPQRFGRVWIHTHPGACPLPSSIDEATFRRVFGRADWAVMAIVARDGASYARLAFHVGPGGSLRIPVRVDYGRSFEGADWEAWEQEYVDHVVAQVLAPFQASAAGADPFLEQDLFTNLEWEELHGGTESARPV